MMPDPVTGLLQALIVVGIPMAVLIWAARERGQTRCIFAERKPLQ